MENQLLTLVRHGKSSWQTAGQEDHDRPLNDRGKRDAPVMAKRLADRGCIPDLILCSSAIRTQETAHYLAHGLGLEAEKIRTSAELYLASPATLLTTLHTLASDCTHVMIIAHNPGLEDLSGLLSEQCSAPMPTLGVRHFSVKPGTDLRRWVTRSQRTDQGQVDPTHPVTGHNNGPTPGSSPEVVLVFEDYPKNT